MAPHRTRLFPIILSCLALATVRCSGGGDAGAPDAAAAFPDGDVAEPDGESDPGPEAGPDAESDSGSDAGTDPADSGEPADATAPGFRIVSVDVDDGTVFRLAHAAHPEWTGDLWPCTWGDDGRLYTANGDGIGFGKSVADIVFSVVDGSPPETTGHTSDDAWGGTVAGLWVEDLTLNRKPTGLTCVDGDIYLFAQNLRTGFDPDHEAFGDAPHASVSFTRDHGATWEYDATKPMFTDHVFTTGFFLDYGRCQEHRKDDFEYVYGLDYNWRFSSTFLQTKMYLARVPRHEIMDRDAWEFLDGIADGHPSWSADIGRRLPVLEDEETYCGDQSAISQGHVVYIPQLDRYLYSSRAECAWIFYEAPEPWGPWTLAGVKTWKGKWTEEYHAGYNVVVPSKFLDPDGRGGWAVSSLSSGTFGGKYYNMGFRRFRLGVEEAAPGSR
jgi:hypothetical protein